jgi:hypothetical protein
VLAYPSPLSEKLFPFENLSSAWARVIKLFTVAMFAVHGSGKGNNYPEPVVQYNRTGQFKNVNSCLNTNIYSYLEISRGQSSNLYLNVAHFFNTSVC